MDKGARPARRSPDTSIFGRDRRRACRHRVHSPAYANLSGSSPGAALELCEVLNISETGVCIQASSPMKTNRLLPLCLDLSETGAQIHVVGHVVWSDPSGRTGIRFPELAEASRTQLQQWLERNAKAEAKAAANGAGTDPEPRPVQSKPSSAASYTSLVSEWGEIEKEVELYGPDLDPALHLIAQRALTLTWASGTAIALINKLRPSEMVCRARAGTDSPEIGARLEAGSGFSGECVRSGKAITCDDTEYDSRVDRASCRALGVRSIVAVPVKRDDEVIGILEVFSPEPAAFWENDITVLQRLAGMITRAVRRAEHSRADVLAVPIGPEPGAEVEKSAGEADFEYPGFVSPPSSLLKQALPFATGILCVTVIIWVLAPWIAKIGRAGSDLAAPTAQANSSDDSYLTANLSELKKLASQGNPGAQYSLGMRYDKGDSVRQDYREAMHWYLLAADKGHIRAQARVAALFWAGRGIPQDYSKAYYWGLLAQAGGDETGRTIVQQTAPYLSPAQIAAEQRQAENWLHAHHIGQTDSTR